MTVVARTASPRTPQPQLEEASEMARTSRRIDGTDRSGPPRRLDRSHARRTPGDDRSGLGRRPVRFARLERFTPMNRSWTIFCLHARAAIAAGRFSSSRRRNNRSRYPRATPVDLLPSRGRVMYVWLPLRTREVELDSLPDPSCATKGAASGVNFEESLPVNVLQTLSFRSLISMVSNTVI